MIKEFLNDYGLYIYIGLGILLFLLIIILIFSRKNKTVDEVSSSILDVDIDGVIDKDFDYGYEKEDTIVMKPIEPKKSKKSKKKK